MSASANFEDLLSTNFDELEEMFEENQPTHPPTTSSAAIRRFEYLTEDEINEKITESTPLNTRKKTAWAVKAFRDWHRFHLTQTITEEGELNVYKDIDEMNESDLNFCLKKFVFEVRKQNGERHPPRSLYDLFAMINYYLQTNLGRKYSLHSSIEFLESRKCLNTAMKETEELGILSGANKSKAISLNDESLLWESGILGANDNKQLCQTLIYLIGIHFCLRGGNELRRLRCGPDGQIKHGIDSDGKDCLIYTEDVSKCRQGGVKSLGKPGKIVYAYHNELNHERCVVCIYDLYVSKRPKNARSDSLFLAYNVKGRAEWYKNMALGHNSLTNVVKTLTQGLKGKYTNQSLRRTGATRLFQGGVPEDIICKKMGHRSLAVREYKEMSACYEKQLSATLYGNNEEKRVTCGPGNDMNLGRLIQGNTFNNCTVNINVNNN